MGDTRRILRAITSSGKSVHPWAITEDYLRLIVEIGLRQNLDPAAVEAQTGRRLDNTRTVEERGGVAIIPVIGPIARYLNLFSEISGGTSIQVLAKDFTAALNNPEVRAILLNIDSPGGEANGVHEFANMVYAARGKKPIVAYVGGMGCSAAYWIASAADEIVTDATALVGSIGVVAAMPIPEGDEIIFVSSQSPRKHPDVTTEDGKADIQYTIDALAYVFIESVARNRGKTIDEVLDTFGGGSVFVGKHALVVGMTDRLGSYEETLAGMVGRERGGVAQARLDTAVTATAQAESHLRAALAQNDQAARLHIGLTQGKPLSAPDIARVSDEARRILGLSAPSAAASAARGNKPTLQKESSHMSEPIETTRAAPLDPPDVTIDAPAMSEEERQSFFAAERARYQQQIEAIRAEARLEVQREMAKERRAMHLTAWAQDMTAATLERPCAVPIEAKDLSAFAIALDGLNPKLTEQFQGFMGRILDAGLIDFREVGSSGGADDRDARAQFNALVDDYLKAHAGTSKVAAIQAVSRAHPDLYEQQQRTVPAKKGGR